METKKDARTKCCIISSEKGLETTYGLKVSCPISGETLFYQEDICPNLSSLSQFVNWLNDSDVNPIHFPGMIEDFLEELYG